MKVPRIFFGALTGVLVNLGYSSLEPILAYRLQDYPAVNDNGTYRGLMFAIQPLLYMLSNFLVPCIVPKWVEPQLTLMVSIFVYGIGTLFVGPVYAETGLVSMIVGLAVTGFILGPMVVPIMPEMLQATRASFKEGFDFERASNLLSGIANSAFGLGQAVGPLLGSTLYSTVGFRLTNDVVGAIYIVCFFLYFLCADGMRALRESRASKRLRTQSEASLATLIDDEIKSVKESVHFRSTVKSGASLASLKQTIASQQSRAQSVASTFDLN